MKRILVWLMALCMCMTWVGAVAQEQKPDTWIADRTIVVRSFIDDQGLYLPDDTVHNAVADELRARTGISLEFQYTAGVNDLEVMTTMMASGDIPDVVTFYLNDSSRPEFPILLKAAREGMFADLSPYFADSKVFSKYLQEGYLPSDTRDQVMWRPEFNGACYLAQLQVIRSFESAANKLYTGMYLRKDIADALQVNSFSIHTLDDLYNLLLRIRDGGFVDNNGQPVYPLGPSIWGGSYDRRSAVEPANFGREGFDLYEGKVAFLTETPFAMEQVEFYQKLLAENLMNMEMFSMDTTRAEELCRSNSCAIINQVHNYIDIFKENDYIPLLIENWKGEYNVSYENGKTGYGGFAISSKAKNPEEIFALIDYLATREGKLLWLYGIEGQHYTLDENGNPLVKPEYYEWVKTADPREVRNIGVGGGWILFLANTDIDAMADFGEPGWGLRLEPDRDQYGDVLFDLIKETRTSKYIEGFAPTGYLSNLPDVESRLSPLLQETNDIMVQAIFSGSAESAKSILDSYNTQLKAAGLDAFKAYLEEVYAANPTSINFIGDK